MVGDGEAVVYRGLRWNGIKQLQRYVRNVRITTADVRGTGFLVSRSSETTLVGIATAAHVVLKAKSLRQRIRIDHYASGETLVLRHTEREILHEDRDNDTAALMMDGSKLPLPKQVLGLIGKGKTKKVGVELGWLGFPAVAEDDSLCFFSGRISAYMRKDKTYLIDGVAIHGVSGGPAFSIGGNSVEIVGVVSHYRPNRETGEALPGMSVAQQVHQFQWLAKELKTLDEAAKKSEASKKRRREASGRG